MLTCRQAVPILALSALACLTTQLALAETTKSDPDRQAEVRQRRHSEREARRKIIFARAVAETELRHQRMEERRQYREQVTAAALSRRFEGVESLYAQANTALLQALMVIYSRPVMQMNVASIPVSPATSTNNAPTADQDANQDAD